VKYQDTTGKNGILKAGGLEWMNAGGGAWHQGNLLGQGHVTGFQLWIPMPPGVEDGPSLGQYVSPEDVTRIALPGGEVLVLLGELNGDYGRARSCIESHQDMTYLALRLRAGASWRYSPPASHEVGWAFPFVGISTINGAVALQEMLIFEGTGDIAIAAPDTPTEVLIGSAKRHQHELVLGPSSVHTNAKSLDEAMVRMRSIKP
jgi:redox-sensitive bicupin YhaK (pirin superfamily)